MNSILTISENIYGVPVPGPALELPGRPGHKDGNNALPLSWGEARRVVYHPVRDLEQLLLSVVNSSKQQPH